MNEQFKAVRVSEHVYWVGAVDWAVRDFHGYSTDRGSSYNAYLVMADAVTLIDTVKAPFKNELLSRIASVIDPRDIRYIVSNHSEMDHSGCLADIWDIVRPEKVFASVMGAKALLEHFHLDREIVPVKDGESLSLGNVELRFIETRMLHWPDSMFTYLGEDQLLFSQDAFGMHLASGERFADEIDDGVLEYEAAKYYANILLPYSPLVAKLLARVDSLGLTIETIGPDHGPIWRKDVQRIVDWYARWCVQKPTLKALVVYDTMWQSTAAMARAIGEGLVESGASARLMPLASTHRSQVATEILDAGALIVGTPTLNNNIFPTVADVLTYLKGLRPRNLIGAAFGSYGWSGDGVAQVRDALNQMKIEPIGEDIKIKYVPDDETLARCRSLGKLVAERLEEICAHE